MPVECKKCGENLVYDHGIHRINNSDFVFCFRCYVEAKKVLQSWCNGEFYLSGFGKIGLPDDEVYNE